ncbi:hypothetical protein GCM10007872_23400 [Gluconobacter sphaericus NBRC 12467]|uniref:Uncharacterized protein n=1 Tax=Gluconobacter sphaericus NBRC 12467 TaxID=1307951 RepID=A0AA37WCB3_9PROT|nr:hypothetical protein GSP01_28090 [Gluconobacter sphaericus NBRC 12467]GLQ85431.1 hypothetical protein GCM10007872_23400 [Gluconobacter sphaericus NBRC 12467]
MIEVEFVLRSFETFLDPHQRLEQRPLRALGGGVEKPPGFGSVFMIPFPLS